MKMLFIVSLVLLFNCIAFAQTDTACTDAIPTINKEHVQYIFNPETNSVNFSYNYSGLWDFDGDHQKDSLYFVGNGAAHTYFYLRLKLSSDKRLREFQTVQLDMPYMNGPATLVSIGKNPAVQFVVSDFNKDGIDDLYLNFNNPFGSVPKSWKAKGIRTKYVIVSFTGKQMKLKDY